MCNMFSGSSNTCKQITSPSSLRDVEWATHNCTLGFNVCGMFALNSSLSSIINIKASKCQGLLLLSFRLQVSGPKEQMVRMWMLVRVHTNNTLSLVRMISAKSTCIPILAVNQRYSWDSGTKVFSVTFKKDLDSISQYYLCESFNICSLNSVRHLITYREFGIKWMTTILVHSTSKVGSWHYCMWWNLIFIWYLFFSLPAMPM